MAQQRNRFVEGAVAKRVDKAQAGSIFDLVDKFAGYGFNKSHAAAYALVAYQTAYLKANHPVEFMAASMSFEISNTDKLAMFCEEARRLGIAMLPPSVNRSTVDFVPEEGRIRYALAALKNVGEAAVAGMTAERSSNGPYRSLSNFAQRIDAKSINKRALETFAAAGAFEEFEPNRAMLHANADTLLALAQRTAENRIAGQNDLFGGGGKAESATPLQLRHAKAWPAMEQLSREQEAVGFYLSGHPLDEYRGVLNSVNAERWADFSERLNSGVTSGVLAGVVVSKRELTSAKGNRFAFAAFSDPSGQFESVVFSDVLADAGEALEPGKAVLVHVEATRKGEEIKLKALLIQSLDKAAGAAQKGLTILLDADALAREPGAIAKLRELLEPGGRGEVRLLMPLRSSGNEVEIKLKGRFHLSPAHTAKIEGLACVRQVRNIWEPGSQLAA